MGKTLSVRVRRRVGAIVAVVLAMNASKRSMPAAMDSEVERLRNEVEDLRAEVARLKKGSTDIKPL